MARAGEIGQGLLWMAESIRKAPEDRPEFLRMARANMAAWGECTIPLRAILEHQGIIERALYCDGGRSILTGSRDGTARFWDAATGRPLRPPIRHGDQVLWVAISPDGRRVATAGSDRRVRLWEAETGRPVGQPLFHPRAGHLGRFLARRPPAGDPRYGEYLPTLGCHHRAAVRGADRRRLGPQDPVLARRPLLRDWKCGWRGAVVEHIRRTARRTRDEIRLPHQGRPPRAGPPSNRDRARGRHGPGLGCRQRPGPVGPPIPDGLALAFSPDGRLLLASDSRGRARLWDMATGRDRGPIFPHPPAISCADLLARRPASS